MARSFDISAHKARERERELSLSRNRRLRYIDDLADFRKVSLSNTHCLIGDRTDNTPPLRHHSRQSMRFDKELSTIAYLVQPGAKYWHESVPMTLAIITKARMIMASNKNIKHEGEDTRFLIT
jgi:hypothetical protein